MLFWIFSKIQKICCPRKKRDENKIQSSKLPWLWIGVKFPDGNIGDMTYEINSAINYDVKVIDLKFLRSVFPVHPSVTWTYIDSQTLEEKEFPSTGLVIDEH
jgi:hypothetical protein